MATVGTNRHPQITTYRGICGRFCPAESGMARGLRLDRGTRSEISRGPKDLCARRRGEIYFAVENGEVIGTCAAIRPPPHARCLRGDPAHSREIELAKLAVAPVAQGRGLGRRLS